MLKTLAKYGPPVLPPKMVGWLSESNKAAIRKCMVAGVGDIIEIGAFAGMSARYICEVAPDARLFCIDPWDAVMLGDVPTYNQHATMHRQMFDQFVANLWDHRGRVVPVQTNSRDGLRTLHGLGIRPSLVYVDGGHEYDDALADITEAFAYFPDAAVAVDDYYTDAEYTWEGVRDAVDEARRMFPARRFEVEPGNKGDIDPYGTAIFYPA